MDHKKELMIYGGRRFGKLFKLKNVGKKVFINENARVMLGLSDGIVYTIKDVLDEDVEYKIVLSSDELGKDWVGFFDESELINIEQ